MSVLRTRLTDGELSAMDEWQIDAHKTLFLGALLDEVRHYRAIRDFAKERYIYPANTWGEKELARQVLLVDMHDFQEYLADENQRIEREEDARQSREDNGQFGVGP